VRFSIEQEGSFYSYFRYEHMAADPLCGATVRFTVQRYRAQDQRHSAILGQQSPSNICGATVAQLPSEQLAGSAYKQA
jgi:hypothetical protein